MAAITENRSGLGLKLDWSYGDDNWDADFNTNIRMLGLFGVHPSVKSRAVNTPPGTPAAGDAYIIGPSPTGDWTGHANELTVWWSGAWLRMTPRLGYLFYIEDEQVISVFKTAWSAGVAI